MLVVQEQEMLELCRGKVRCRRLLLWEQSPEVLVSAAPQL